MSPPAKELRLALGMRGGVSLCVWIGGTCREVEAMRASSPSADGHQPESPLTTPFWRRLLTLGGIETVTVDVLSGASAGGLNGVIYAASRMYGFSMDELREVWLSIGALGNMVRPEDSRSGGKPYFPSLLQGDEYFFKQLYDQLGELSEDGQPPVTRPRLDLSLTTTLVEPIHRGTAGSLEGVPAEPRFATTFRFRRRGDAWLDDFGTDDATRREAIARLALAGRATSSYPVAFEAAVVRALRRSSFSAGPAPMDEEPLNVDMAGIFSDAGAAPFVTMDGGVLDNIPLGRAIDAIREAPADRPTRRVLVYVCPGSPWAPTAEPVMDIRDRRTTWGVAQGAIRSRVRPETIAADLAQLDQYHDRIARGRRIRELSFADASERAATLELAQAALDSYRRSRADADAQAVRSLLDDPATVLREDPFPSADWPDWVWRNPLARWPGGARGLDAALASSLMVPREGIEDLLHTPWAPIGRVARLLIELARFIEAHGATDGDRVAASAAKEALYRVLLVHTELSDRMQRLAWVVRATVVQEVADWAKTSLDQVARLSSISEDDAATLRDYIANGDETSLQALRLSRLGLLDQLLAGDGLPGEGVTDVPAALVPVMLSHARALMEIELAPPDEGPQGNDPASTDSGQLLHRALRPDGASELDEQHLAALEVLAFAERAVGARGGTAIEFKILSAALSYSPLAAAFPILLGGYAYGDEAWPTIRERLQRVGPQVTVENKLAGNELQNFAAFLRKEWRANDWMWGRLDAVMSLVHVVVTPDALVAAARRHLADPSPVEELLAELRLAVTRFDGAVEATDVNEWEAFVAATVWDPVAEGIGRTCGEAVAAAIDPTAPAPGVDQIQVCLIASRQWQILADELARQQNDDVEVDPRPPTTPLTPRRAVEVADGYWVGKQTQTRPSDTADQDLVAKLLATAGETLKFNLQGKAPKRLAGAVQGVVGVLGWAWLGKRTSFKRTAVAAALIAALALLVVPGIPAFCAGWSEPGLYWALAAVPGALVLVLAAVAGAAKRWIAMLILGLVGAGLVAMAGFYGENVVASAAVIGVAAMVLLLAQLLLGKLRPPMSPTKPDETRDGVPLTNLDQPLFDGAEATKRDLIDYLDGVRDRILPELEDRPLSVIRVHRGQEAFMQKNVPKYTPDWVPTVSFWAETSKRDVAYALCNDRRTLLWFGNQRAVEYHPALVRAARPDRMTHLILDLDPPEGDSFDQAVQAARLVRAVLDELELAGAVKTSGAKGLHVFIPIDDTITIEEAAAATRAIAVRAAALDPSVATTEFVKDERGGKVFVDSTRVGGGTVIAAYSPRVRPGVPVSFPVSWDDLDSIAPRDFTVHTALGHLGDGDPWAERMPAPQRVPATLVEEGGEIPVGRVAAMHEGKRRKRAAEREQG